MLGDQQQVVHRERRPTGSAHGYDHIIEEVARLVDSCRQYAPGCEAIGIGTPGSVSLRTGLMKNCNTTCLNGRRLREDLEGRLGLAVRLENDANLFALAEAQLGAGRGAELVFGVILGTGVGGGIVYRGELVAGHQRLAGEWGHHTIAEDGPPCYCGHRGCVETFLSGPAVERRYKERTGEELSMGQIFDKYRTGDAQARGVVEQFLARFGRALANVIDILDPDVIVLGGGLSNLDELYSEGRAAIEQRVFNDELRTPIVRNQLGDSAGVIGAALLV